MGTLGQLGIVSRPAGRSTRPAGVVLAETLVGGQWTVTLVADVRWVNIIVTTAAISSALAAFLEQASVGRVTATATPMNEAGGAFWRIRVVATLTMRSGSLSSRDLAGYMADATYDGITWTPSAGKPADGTGLSARLIGPASSDPRDAPFFRADMTIARVAAPAPAPTVCTLATAQPGWLRSCVTLESRDQSGRTFPTYNAGTTFRVLGRTSLSDRGLAVYRVARADNGATGFAAFSVSDLARMTGPCSSLPTFNQLCGSTLEVGTVPPVPTPAAPARTTPSTVIPVTPITPVAPGRTTPTPIPVTPVTLEQRQQTPQTPQTFVPTTPASPAVPTTTTQPSESVWPWVLGLGTVAAVTGVVIVQRRRRRLGRGL
jgi:hypothetical protein